MIGYVLSDKVMPGFSLKFEAADPMLGWPSIWKYFGNTGDNNYSTDASLHFSPVNIADHTKSLPYAIEEIEFCWGNRSLQYVRFLLSNGTKRDIGDVNDDYNCQVTK